MPFGEFLAFFVIIALQMMVYASMASMISILTRKYAQGVNFHNYDRYLLKKNSVETVSYPVDCYIWLSRKQGGDNGFIKQMEADKFTELVAACYLSRNVKNNILCSVLLSSRAELLKVCYTDMEELYQMLYNYIVTILSIFIDWRRIRYGNNFKGN